MTTNTPHSAHEQLLARVRLAERRLVRLATDIGDDAELRGTELSERAADLAARAKALADRIRSWTEVQIGAQTAVEDLAAAADALETDISAAKATEPAGYEEAVDRQVRTWRTRIDRLRLQGELASMEARDELEHLAHRMEDVRNNAIGDLQNVVGDAKGAVIDLRTDVEKVFVDVRRAVEHAASSLTKDNVTDQQD